MIYKTFHKKLQIKQYEPHLKPGVISSERENVSVSHVAPVVVPLLLTRW
jgi:hypothetical protein